MKVLFDFQDFFEVVTNGYTVSSEGSSKAQRIAYKESQKKDCKIMFLLHLSVDDAQFEKISIATATKEVWDILQKCHAGSEKGKKV